MFGMTWLASEVVLAFHKNKEREAWIDTLPEDEQQKIRAKDKQDVLDYMQHRRALEIAEAGRPRNFWGK